MIESLKLLNFIGTTLIITASYRLLFERPVRVTLTNAYLLFLLGWLMALSADVILKHN